MEIQTSELKKIYQEINSINYIVYILKEYCKAEDEIFEIMAIGAVLDCISKKAINLSAKLFNKYEDTL